MALITSARFASTRIADSPLPGTIISLPTHTGTIHPERVDHALCLGFMIDGSPLTNHETNLVVMEALSFSSNNARRIASPMKSAAREISSISGLASLNLYLCCNK